MSPGPRQPYFGVPGQDVPLRQPELDALQVPPAAVASAAAPAVAAVVEQGCLADCPDCKL